MLPPFQEAAGAPRREPGGLFADESQCEALLSPDPGAGRLLGRRQLEGLVTFEERVGEISFAVRHLN